MFIVECNDSIIIHDDCTTKLIRINVVIFYQYNSLVDVEKENVIFHNVKDIISMLIERVFYFILVYIQDYNKYYWFKQ